MSRLTWPDLLIEDLNPDDCRRWLGHWSWLVGGTLAPAFLNKFGSWFLRRPEGHVEMLDVLTGAVEQVAGSYEVPGPGQCYALAPHPALGGPNPSSGDPVDPRFVVVMDIGVWQSLCGQFLRGQGSTGPQEDRTSETP